MIYKITEKPFYRKFSYRIKILIYDSENGGIVFLKKHQKRIERFFKKHNIEYKTRSCDISDWSNWNKINNITARFYYFSDHRAADFIEENFHDKIIEFYKPVNQSQTDLMSNNIKIRVKEKLYYNKFRWVIRFNYRSQEKLEAIKSIRHWLDIQKRIEKVDFMIAPFYKYSNLNVYSNIKADVAVLRLMFPDINCIDEIRLISEIKEE